jgi:hypothetical protein
MGIFYTHARYGSSGRANHWSAGQHRNNR